MSETATKYECDVCSTIKPKNQFGLYDTCYKCLADKAQYDDMTDDQLTEQADKLWNSIIFSMTNNVRAERQDAMGELSGLREIERLQTLREEV